MDSRVMSFSDCYTSLIQTKVSRRLLPLSGPTSAEFLVESTRAHVRDGSVYRQLSFV